MLFNRWGSTKWDVATALSRGVDSQWKKYTKADFLTCDKQGDTAGQAHGLKEKRFQIKTVCISGEARWRSYPNWPFPFQSGTDRLFIKDKQAPAFCCPTAVLCWICCSHMLHLVPFQVQKMGRKNSKTCSKVPTGNTAAQLWPVSSAPFCTAARPACLTKYAYKTSLLIPSSGMWEEDFISPCHPKSTVATHYFWLIRGSHLTQNQSRCLLLTDLVTWQGTSDNHQPVVNQI